MERTYYWILARSPDPPHNVILIAGGEDEQQAREKALETLSGLSFEIRGLRTRSLPRASAMIRGIRLNETHDIRKASQRLGHERSAARMIKRLRGKYASH